MGKWSASLNGIDLGARRQPPGFSKVFTETPTLVREFIDIIINYLRSIAQVAGAEQDADKEFTQVKDVRIGD